MRGFGLTGTTRPARTSRTQRCPRPPQARLAIKTTRDRPSRMSRDAETHTTFPNFGKVEYFCGERLTGGGCFARRAKIVAAERIRSDGGRWAQRDPGQLRGAT